MQFTVNLPANIWHRQETNGSYFVLMSTGAESSIELRLMRGTLELENFRTAKRGFKARTVEGFTHVEFKAAAPTAVEFIISSGEVDIDTVDGASVLATIQGLPLQVSNDRGTPGNLLHVTGVSLADAPATATSANAAVAVNDTADLIAAADANRRAIRIANLGPDPVALGPAAQTWAGRVIVLEVGDIWLEDRAANLAWYAITDTGGSASVTWQGITA